MSKMRYSEQPMLLTFNFLMCIWQSIVIMIDKNNVEVIVMISICFFVFSIPLLIDAIKRVRKNNFLTKHGILVEANIHHDEIKYIPMQSIYYVCLKCFYNSDDETHIFRDKCTISARDGIRVKEYLNNLEKLWVLTDDDYKQYSILLNEELESINVCTFNTVPSWLNYIVGGIAFVLLIINIFF